LLQDVAGTRAEGLASELVLSSVVTT
jgi:hypothetical protein